MLDCLEGWMTMAARLLTATVRGPEVAYIVLPDYRTTTSTIPDVFHMSRTCTAVDLEVYIFQHRQRAQQVLTTVKSKR